MIQLNQVTKIYGAEGNETRVLHGVSLRVAQGEFVAIMGPSGSGKSTMLHILGLLDGLSSGEYFLNGVSVAGLDEDEKARLRNKTFGFVFQAFNLLPRVSVFENVKLPLMYSSVSKSEWDDRAKKALEKVGMLHRMNHQPSQLSGGEKQRVAIARALMCEPSVIFADEPTGNLDSKNSAQVMDVFTRLNQEQGTTIILITHEDDIAHYAKRVVRMRDGMIADDSQRNSL